MSVVGVLADECGATISVLEELPEDDFARPTNCPPWNLKELVVHTRFSITVPDPLPVPAPGARLCEAADYYRRPERNSEEYRSDNVRIAQELAQRFPSGQSAARDFDRTIQMLTTRFERDDLGTPIRYGDFRALTLGDYLLTRLLAVAAHGIDMALTLEMKPWTRSATATLLRPMLVSLLGDEPPPTLSWSDRDLLEIGTGRRLLSAGERDKLGAMADAFPLIS